MLAPPMPPFLMRPSVLEPIRTVPHLTPAVLGKAMAQIWVVDGQRLAPTVDLEGNEAACPITLDGFVDPVVIDGGGVYEKEAIMQWLEHKNKAPCTNSPLRHKQMLRLAPMRQVVEEFLRSGGQDASIGSKLDEATVKAMQAILLPPAARREPLAALERALASVSAKVAELERLRLRAQEAHEQLSASLEHALGTHHFREGAEDLEAALDGLFKRACGGDPGATPPDWENAGAAGYRAVLGSCTPAGAQTVKAFHFGLGAGSPETPPPPPPPPPARNVSTPLTADATEFTPTFLQEEEFPEAMMTDFLSPATGPGLHSGLGLASAGLAAMRAGDHDHDMQVAQYVQAMGGWMMSPQLPEPSQHRHAHHHDWPGAASPMLRGGGGGSGWDYDQWCVTAPAHHHWGGGATNWGGS